MLLLIAVGEGFGPVDIAGKRDSKLDVLDNCGTIEFPSDRLSVLCKVVPLLLLRIIIL